MKASSSADRLYFARCALWTYDLTANARVLALALSVDGNNGTANVRPSRLAAIGKLLGMSPSDSTDALDELQRQGWVDRQGSNVTIVLPEAAAA